MEDESLEIKFLLTITEAIGKIDELTAKVKELRQAVNGTKFNMKGFQEGASKAKNNIKNAGKEADSLGKKMSKAGQTMNKVFDFQNFRNTLSYLKSIGNVTKNAIEQSMDYTETLNKFQVAMGSTYIDRATKFREQMSEAFGYSKTVLMDYQSTYKNIMYSIGNISEEVAYQTSEYLTQMASDYSSLFNVDLDKSMKKFQSALVGSVQPIRSDSGYDVTVSTLYGKYQELGGTKKQSELNQVEKRLLRIIVLMQQMENSNAMGDLARTIEAPSNQVRILKEQVQQLGVALGNVFMGTIGKILPYINGFIMALRAVIQTISTFFGFKESKSSVLSDPIQEASAGAGGLADNIDKASGKAKEFKKEIMGFDKLNNIAKETDSSGGGTSSGGGGGGMAVDAPILDGLKKYNSLMDSVRMKANDIRDRIMEWLGFTKIIDPITGEISWYLNEGYQNIQKIRDALLVIGTIVAGAFIVKKIVGIYTALKSVAMLLLSGGAISTGLASIGTAVGGLFGLTLSGLGAIVVGITTVIAGIVALVYGGIKLYQWAVGDAIGETDRLAGTSEQTIKRLKPVQNAFDELSDTIKEVNYDGLELTEEEKTRIISSVDKLTAELKSALQDYVNASLDELNNLYFNMGVIDEEEYNNRLARLQEYQSEEEAKIDNHAQDLKDKAIEMYDENGKLQLDKYAEYRKNLSEYNSEVLNDLTLNNADKLRLEENANYATHQEQVRAYSELLQEYAKDRDNAMENAKAKYDYAIQCAEDQLQDEPELLRQAKEEAKKVYDEEVKNAQDTFDEIYDSMAQNCTDMGDYISRDDGKLLSNWTTTWENIKETAINALKSVVEWLGNKMFEETQVTVTANANARGIETRASGGPVSSGQMFLARENGMPELIGKIGNTTTVMNNGQIVQAVSTGVATAVARVMQNVSFGGGNITVPVYVGGTKLQETMYSLNNRENNIRGR